MRNIVVKNPDYDEKEFEKIIEENKNMITSIIKRMELECGHFRISKDDLFQEGLIALHEAYAYYDKSQKVKFSTFAYMVIKRCLTRYYYQSVERYQHEVYSIDTIELFDHHPLANDYEIHDDSFKYVSEDSEERVDKLFRRLKEEDQHIVALRCMNNTYDEIAEKLNITKKKVDSRLSRLRIRFKEYKNYYNEEMVS